MICKLQCGRVLKTRTQDAPVDSQSGSGRVASVWIGESRDPFQRRGRLSRNPRCCGKRNLRPRVARGCCAIANPVPLATARPSKAAVPNWMIAPAWLPDCLIPFRSRSRSYSPRARCVATFGTVPSRTAAEVSARKTPRSNEPWLVRIIGRKGLELRDLCVPDTAFFRPPHTFQFDRRCPESKHTFRSRTLQGIRHRGIES